ncbi:uncharacterized protein EDB93DRAFT_1252996 [Suillus bovinus]|uniref:uncharacterized protein n=1 Tax=Suillus bovinus TaxID=48563 RepID=UPI001B867F4C|nr:uncharacterized protein EDB93DRAFT_1252996 [Suillus bovinus]KAG2139581.1 hypothetical protein EDB93DRAFT_1252996 [Suillus bovinus]
MLEYSTEDIAAARSLQFTSYIYTSMATFWTYDYACSLDEEWTFLLRSQWTKMKGLYIVARYLPFILLATDLYLTFIPNENPGKCRMLDSISSGIGMLLVICSEWFFILRTYALWNNNKILLVALVSAFSSFLVASIIIAFATTVPAAHATSAVPGITGCYRSSTNYKLFIPFLLFSVFELGLLILTHTCHTKLADTPKSYVRCPTKPQHILLCMRFSVLDSEHLHIAVSPRFLPDYFGRFMILVILATRMHLHLWQTNRHGRGSVAFTDIPMSDISFVTSTA